MSSQENAGIPLTYALQPRGYKLLELPPDLLELLEGENAPSAVTIHHSASAALLKAAGRTYSMRQKNTSNALILLETAGVSSPDGAASTTATTTETTTVAPATSPPSPTTSSPRGQTSPQRAGLRAIAIVHEVVELVSETEGATGPAARARGKWHERFGKAR